MKIISAALVSIGLMVVASSAGAACSSTNALKQAGIRQALGGKWACAKDGTDMWNEQIVDAASGTFKECHSGLTTGPDPIDTNKGTFAITNNPAQVPDTITYNYGATGGSYTYQVYEVTAGSVYSFCRITDGQIYTVRIAACPTSAPNTCP